MGDLGNSSAENKIHELASRITGGRFGIGKRSTRRLVNLLVQTQFCWVSWSMPADFLVNVSRESEAVPKLVSVGFVTATVLTLISFGVSLWSWWVGRIDIIPSSLEVIRLYQKESWSDNRTTQILAYKTALAAHNVIESGKAKSERVKAAFVALTISVTAITAVATAAVIDGTVIKREIGGEQVVIQSNDPKRPGQSGQPSGSQGGSSTEAPVSNPWDKPELRPQTIHKDASSEGVEKRDE